MDYVLLEKIVLGSVIALQMTVIKEEKLGDFEKKGDH